MGNIKSYFDKALRQVVVFKIISFLDSVTLLLWRVFAKLEPLKPAAATTSPMYMKLHATARVSISKDVLELCKESVSDECFEWVSELALVTQTPHKRSAPSFEHGLILYSALSDYIDKQKDNCALTIFESGTARGFSALCMAKVLDDKHVEGFIYTVDILSHERPLHWNSVKDLVCGPQTRAELLSDYKHLLNRIVFVGMRTEMFINQVFLPQIDFAFLDAEHTAQAIQKEFSYVDRRLKQGGTIVFDDYDQNSFPQMCIEIDQLLNNSNYDTRILKSEGSRHYLIACKI